MEKRIWWITSIVAVVCFWALGAGLYQRYQRQQIEMLHVEAALTSPKDSKALLALAEEEIKLLKTNNMVDYWPWVMKGDACIARGDYVAAEACYREALQSIGNPRQLKSSFLDDKGHERDLSLSRLLTLKKLEWIKAGKRWTSTDEIVKALREDLKKAKAGEK